MKFSLAKEASIYTALTASVVSGITMLLLISGSKSLYFIFPIITIVIVFIIVFLITNRLIKKVIPQSTQLTTREVFILSEKDTSFDLKKEKEEMMLENQIIVSDQILEIDRLKEMERYRKEFLGNVSHELKTPIFNIQGYVLTLLDGGLEDPNINRKYLERTEKSINRLISIIEDLETISRHEAGELKLEREEFNLVQLVEEVFEAQEIRAKKRDIKLQLDKKYKKPILVSADKMKIFQVLSNLITNSIYYGKPGGKTRVSISDELNRTLVEVNDNGIGVAPADIPRIFERFYRVDKSRSREQGGTGLGLSIVKHIIEAHSETIRVKSRLGKGSSFIFSLPKAD